jgi:hypothetical protein
MSLSPALPLAPSQAQLTDMKNHERENLTTVTRYTREHRRLFQPLLELQAEVARLQAQYVQYGTELEALRWTQKQVAVVEERVKNKVWEQEILMQRLQHVMCSGGGGG